MRSFRVDSFAIRLTRASVRAVYATIPMHDEAAGLAGRRFAGHARDRCVGLKDAYGTRVEVT